MGRAARDIRQALLAWALVGLCPSCAMHEGTPLRIGRAQAVTIAGLGPCDDGEHGPVRLDPAKPVVVLVHGCHASAGRFRALSRVFAFHDQQALCFAYDDRERLSQSAERLGSALDALSSRLERRELVVLGHSQGGLVARLALTAPARRHAGQLKLVTVSAPFNGIRAARDCGATWLHALSFGTTIAVCRFATGAKWNQIHPKAWPVLHPAPLVSNVAEHLRITTDERNTCRRKGLTGECLQDDYVFSLAEQDNARMHDERVREARVAAGHAEIVGSDDVEPDKLIRVLQDHGVMAPTPPEREGALQALLARLF